MYGVTSKLATIVLLSLSSHLASAHFKLITPKPRGFDENTLAQYPCGGQNTPSAQRTEFPISGAPVQLYLEHTQTQFEVLLALGNNPSGADFTNIVVPTFQELGPRDFCLGDVDIAGALGSAVKAGMNATLLVMSNGDTGAGSGLYNCADITLTSNANAFTGGCKNSTGVQVQAVPGPQLNANGSMIGGGGSSSGSGSGSGGSGSSSGGGNGGAALDVPAATLGLAVAGAFAAFALGF